MTGTYFYSLNPKEPKKHDFLKIKQRLQVGKFKIKIWIYNFDTEI